MVLQPPEQNTLDNLDITRSDPEINETNFDTGNLATPLTPLTTMTIIQTPIPRSRNVTTTPTKVKKPRLPSVSFPYNEVVAHPQ